MLTIFADSDVFGFFWLWCYNMISSRKEVLKILEYTV